MHKLQVYCEITESRACSGMLSIRVRGCVDDAVMFRRALSDAGFEAGDMAVVVSEDEYLMLKRAAALA